MAFDHAAYAYRRLVAAGVHPQWAAAAVGNSAHETGDFRYPKSLVPGENSGGYAHWNAGAGRLQPFERYMRSRGVEDYLDPQTNMDYMINEDYPKNYPQLWNQMRTAPHSMEAATKQYMDTYERPAAATAGLDSRTSRAQRIYRLMQENQPQQQVTERVNVPEGQLANPSMTTGQSVAQQFPNVWAELTKNRQNTNIGQVQQEASGQQSPVPGSTNKQGEMPKPGGGKPPGYGNMGMAKAGMAGLLGPENYVDVSQMAMPLIMQLITMSKAAGSLNG
jgi:hypothetical protein